MDPAFVFQRLAISLGLGLLIGLQREHAVSQIAGVRTFPLIALLGTITGLLAVELEANWILLAGFLALAVVIMVGNLARIRDGAAEAGVTTEVAMLLVYGLGAYLVVGSIPVAVVTGGVIAVLLYLKGPLHHLAARIGDRDFKAVIQFVVIALVILPVLPDQTYGPYDVLNPYKIWLMVVLIVGISLAGYVAYKAVGARSGTLLGGAIGGMISSTATTVSYARRTRQAPDSAPLAAIAILLASAVGLVRVLVEIGIVARTHLVRLGLPVAALLGVVVLTALVAWLLTRQQPQEIPEQKSPTELKAALFFGAMYAVVLLAVAMAKHHFGSHGLYVVGAVSGLTDMDAITLSTANMVSQEQIEQQVAWRVILIATMSNLLFKAGTVALLGHPRLLLRVGLMFAVIFAAGGAILWLWPW